MKKIVFYMSEFRDGGTEVSYINLINEMKLRGISVDLIAGKIFNTKMVSRLDRSGIKIINLGTRHKLLSLLKLSIYFFENDVFAVIADKDRTASSLCLLRKIFRMKFKIFMNAHINYDIYFKNAKQTKKKSFEKLLDEIEGVIAVSSGVAQNLKSTFPKNGNKIHTIYNAVIENNCKVFYSGSYNKYLKKNIPTILAVGRLEREKSYDTLIYAFAILTKKINSHLIILGEGQERRELQKLVDDLSLSDKICLKGFVDNPQEYMVRSSVFVLSSISEGLGNVLIEALGAGIPVVSTDCNYGPAEILENGKYGKLVPVKNPEMLAAAIEETLKNPPDREMLRQRSLDFTAEVSAERYLNVIYKNIND